MLNWNGNWCLISIITSNNRLVILNWDSNLNFRVSLAFMLKDEEGEWDHANCSQKSTQILTRVCQVNIWY